MNFETVRLQTSKPIQLATTQDPAVVFVPCMTAVKVKHLSLQCSTFNLFVILHLNETHVLVSGNLKCVLNSSGI